MKIDRFGCGLELKLDPGTESKVGAFQGYGSIFGNMDAGGDMVAPGAFKASLKEWRSRRKLPKMLLQHGGFLGPAEDGIPVGKYTVMEEDDKGLYVEGELFAIDTQKGKYIYEGIKSGALDGLSIGYIAKEVAYGKAPDEPRRTLKKIDLLEVSIVTFPMNKAAGIEAVKSIEELKTLSDVEGYLRDAGLSHRQATALVSCTRDIVKGHRPGDPEGAIDADLVRHVTNLHTRFKGA